MKLLVLLLINTYVYATSNTYIKTKNGIYNSNGDFYIKQNNAVYGPNGSIVINTDNAIINIGDEFKVEPESINMFEMEE